jgi:large subunit ribosomal protein L13e
MSFDIIAEPTVKSPKKSRPRRGRGFSREETFQAGLTIEDARKMGLLVDLRRKSVYPENVEALKQYMKDLEEIIAALQKEEGTTVVRTDKVAAELAYLRAVKKSEAPLLVDAGIKSLEDLAYCDIPKVAKKTGIDEERIIAMSKAALKKV